MFEQTLSTIIIFVAVFIILWQLRIVTPIYWCRGLFESLREGEWAGNVTGKYAKKFKAGRLWWGYNKNSRHEFVIFNGNLYPSFQIQNWKPRFAIWGSPLINWPQMVKPWDEVDPEEIGKFIWPKGNQADLKVYLSDDPQRKPAEAYFAKEVRQSIRSTRQGNNVNTWLLIESIENLSDSRHIHGFDSWVWAITGVLGAETCKSIGKTVCQKEGFTVEEGRRFLAQHKKDQPERKLNIRN